MAAALPEGNLNTRAWLERLVAFDTTSRNSNLALIADIANYLDRPGIHTHVLPNEDGSKANLFATIGPRDRGGVILSGHTDVVPVDGQPWSTDPFKVTERDGRLAGRGTADMKGFIASVLAHVPAMLARPLATPVHLAFSYDEEVGCLGVHGIVRHIQSSGAPRPRLCIVGEPTEMQVVNAHKSIHSLSTHVVGLEGHSSAPAKGVNAILSAARLIAEIEAIADDLRAPERLDHRFEPPYSTLHVGTIKGGTAKNIIPRSCMFDWELRWLPGSADEQFTLQRFEAASARELARMRAVHPAAEILTTTIARAVGLVPEKDSPAETLALRLAGSNQTSTVAYATEAGIIQEAAIPTVVCGPGNIREAHKPDEYIDISQLAECDAFLDRLLKELAA